MTARNFNFFTFFTKNLKKLLHNTRFGILLDFRNIKDFYDLLGLLQLKDLNITILKEHIHYLQKDLDMVIPQIYKLYKEKNFSDEKISKLLNISIEQLHFYLNSNNF